MAIAIGQITLTDVHDGAQTEIQYASNTSLTTAPTSGWSASVPAPQSGYFVWRRERVVLSDGTTEPWKVTRTTGESGAKGDKGDKGDTGEPGIDGNDGTSITSVDVEYAISTSSTTAPTTGWDTNSPTWEDGKYIWSRTKTTYSVGDPTYTSPVCITGGKGETGSTGPVGQGIESITEEYYLSTSKTTQTGGSWGPTPPTWSTGKYLWTRSKIVYKNPADTKYTTPVCDSSWEAVNEIQVGGVNLLKNSQTEKTTSPREHMYYVDAHEILKDFVGKSLTFSFDIKVAVPGSVQFYSTNNARYRIPTTSIPNVTTEFKRVGLTLPISDANNGKTVSYLEFYGIYDSGRFVTVKNMKIETGNVATAWTPAPEDSLPPSIQSSGTTLSVVGGKLDINGEEIRIPSYSQNLTGDGQGYVVWTGSAVQFVIMEPQQSGVNWLPYNGGSAIGVQYILGKFKKTGTTIYDIATITPISPDGFTKEHFMEILADRDSDQFEAWAEALGVEQLFESLAVWDFFADKIKVNTLEISKTVGGELFKLLFTNNGDAVYPILNAYKGSKKVFELDSGDGSVYIEGTGNFSGKVTHEAMETVAHESGSNINLSNTKNLWSTDQLYSGLSSVSTNGTINSASGSYKGVSINGISRLPSSSSRGLISTSSEPTSIWYRYDNYYMLQSVFTVPPGSYYITIQFEARREDSRGRAYIVKNPTSTPVGGTATNPGTILKTLNTSSDEYETITYSSTCTPGEKFSVWIKGYEDRRKGGQATYARNAYYYFYTITGPGVLLRYTNNTYGVISPGQYLDDTFTLSSPQSWSSTNNRNFVKGTNLFNHSVVKNLQAGIGYPASGTAVVDTLSAGSKTYTVEMVRRDANGVTLGTTEGMIQIVAWGGQGSSQGVYDNLSTSITLIAQPRSIKVSALLPKTHPQTPQHDLHIIGTGTEPFQYIYSNNIVDPSSIERKKNVNSKIDSSIELLKKLNVVTFIYKDDPEEFVHTGLIAEEAPEELITANKDGISLGDTVGILVKAVQELAGRVAEFENNDSWQSRRELLLGRPNGKIREYLYASLNCKLAGDELGGDLDASRPFYQNMTVDEMTRQYLLYKGDDEVLAQAYLDGKNEAKAYIRSLFIEDADADENGGIE
jgi:hypothetical protein